MTIMNEGARTGTVRVCSASCPVFMNVGEARASRKSHLRMVSQWTERIRNALGNNQGEFFSIVPFHRAAFGHKDIFVAVE